MGLSELSRKGGAGLGGIASSSGSRRIVREAERV